MVRKMFLLKDYLIFYCLLLKELLTSPWEYMKEWIRTMSYIKQEQCPFRERKKVENPVVWVNIHEWGGYSLVRRKKVSSIPEFQCGLKFQLQRFSSLRKKGKIVLCVTLSEEFRCQDKNYICSRTDDYHAVSNEGMDFSGYSSFYNFIKGCPNAYVILTNSSVNSLQDDFFDGYIRYMEQHPEVGILGTSYSTKCFQSFIRNNFTPHLQSFFLLTTIDVLKEIVAVNKGKFPGAKVTHKLLLIRKGEVGLSQLALKLGYCLAVVMENGDVFRFWKKGIYYSKWSLPLGDMRFAVLHPNRINPIKEEHK